MPFANKSNKSNKSDAASDPSDELAHAGQDTSAGLSRALDSTGIALPGVVAPGSITLPARRPSIGLLRALNPRHRHVLLVDALLEGIAVTQDGDAARVTIGGAAPGDEAFVDLASPFSASGGSGDPEAQVVRILDRRWLRAERLDEILAQQTDLVSFLALARPISTAAHPMLMALLAAIQGATERVEVQAKHILSVPRPARLSPAVAPVIQTPAHGATPSGHATEAFGLAFAMEALIFGAPNFDLRRIAARIEENRVVAGVHYEHDGWQGRRLAATLAAGFARRMGIASTAPTVLQMTDVWTASGEEGALTAQEALPAPSTAVPSGGGASETLRTMVAAAKEEIGE